MSIFRYITNSLQKLNNNNTIGVIYRLASTKSHSPPKTSEDEEDSDIPIKYSSSPASRWQAKATRSGDHEPRLWYEPYVILASLTVFMLYFTVCREENDIDLELNKSLYDRVDGLEEQQLRIAIEYNKRNNLDTTALINRLKELEAAKQQVN